MTAPWRAALVTTFATACLARAEVSQATAPTFADFQGHWTVSRVLGSSPGGVTAEHPRAMIGRSVEWSGTEIRTPGQTCALQDAAIRIEPNRRLEDSFWGGQTIAGLALPKADLQMAFGPDTTPVFEDKGGCAYAVSLDHARMITTFPSGYIYLLRRSQHHR